MQPECRILIVEDESDWLRRLKNYLADEPYSIKIAENFQKAANLLRDHVFDTVLVDLRLRHWKRDNFEGMEILKLIDKVAEEQGTTAIIVSAYGKAQHVREGFKMHGIVDYIDKKELDPEALRQAVRAAVAEAYSRRGEILDRKYGE